MVERIDPFVLTEAQREDSSIAQWAWDSHYWIEYHPGYFECKWCKTIHYSSMGITKDFPLCPGNYAIKKLLDGRSYCK